MDALGELAGADLLQDAFSYFYVSHRGPSISGGREYGSDGARGQRGSLRPRWDLQSTSFSGILRATMLTDRGDVVAVIRAKIAAGSLPCERPATMWVGPGSGKICDGCELPISSEQREYEFGPPGRSTIRLHAECLEIWHIERHK